MLKRNVSFSPALLAMLVVCTSLLVSAAPAASNDAVVYLVPGGGGLRLAPPLGLDKYRPQGGAILGVRLFPHLALEGRGHFTRSSSAALGGQEIDILHGEGNLTLFLTHDTALVPFITAGGGVARLDQTKRTAANAGIGVMTGGASVLGLRLDVRDVMFKSLDESDDNMRHSAEVFTGLVINFGGTPKDTDGDGVPDKIDRCSGTPLGARIDAQGCPVDGDADGVPDGLDGCPATPRGAMVNAQGCPTDTDGDGTFDGLDQCPETPAGARVDRDGCPIDSDRDGVPDGLDACEGTTIGCLVNASGCPTDSDGDGVYDGLDKCPGTPATARVDASGCPIVVSEKETELLDTGLIRLQGISFAVGKADIDPGSYTALDEVGEILARWPELRIEIGGHCDSTGPDEFNQRLSEARAGAVLGYLMSRYSALRRGQFTVVGYGESQPIADNGTSWGRSQNRRVEFKVMNKDLLKRSKATSVVLPKKR